MKRNSQHVLGGVQRWMALCFVLAVAAFGFVQAVHMHASSFTEGPSSGATHCTTCFAAHSVAAAVDVSFSPALTSQPGTVPGAEPQHQARLVIFSSYTRPPPQEL